MIKRFKFYNSKVILIALSFITFYSYGQSSIDFIISLENSSKIQSIESAGEIKPNFSFRVGFDWNENIFNKFYIKSGIRYSQIGYKNKSISAYTGIGEFNPDAIFVLEAELDLVHSYFEIPLGVRYEIVKNKKINPFIEFGISNLIYLKTKSKYKTQFETQRNNYRNKSDVFNKLQIACNSSVGVNYQTNSKIQIFTQLSFRYHLSKINEIELKEHLYSYGFDLGVRKRI